MGLYLGGLIIGRICASDIWGAYFQEGLFLGGYYWNFTVSVDRKLNGNNNYLGEF